MPIARRTGTPARGILAEPPKAAEWLAEGRSHERSGRLAEAQGAFAAAVGAAEREGEAALLAEALRRWSVVCHHRNEADRARELAERSFQVSMEAGQPGLAAEALNAQGGMAFELGQMQLARSLFGRALVLGESQPGLRSRIEQNLGILATIQGDHHAALGHYRSSLDACAATGDDQGCAIAYHNLGMIRADRREWADAERCYRQSLELAERIGDIHLQGLCLLNQAEVHLAREAFEEARAGAEAALAIFDELGSRMDKADAYRVLGVVYRDTGRHALAEARLHSSIEVAVATGTVLSEAEACRELGRLYQAMGRNQEALTRLNAAYRLFLRLDAHLDLVDVQAKVADLEGTFLAVVRDWGQSIESADSYTHGHCERVATYAARVAEELGVSDVELTTIRLGAYLHDVGKVRVPHEVLNKPGRLTPEEFAIIQQHPVWGVELLAGIDFPWDITPIIRWHHEKHDGSGYPDRLAGDAIPLAAQIICIVDIYDALTTTRSYRPAMTQEQAVACMLETPQWWRPAVLEAFLRTVGVGVQVAA
ncbi:MAG: tetratricopeptide repeat protein [Gemmatimonadetes bacterium]|nr:tetratricopeptide repeat protein [Gemmatimonadota bacterium]